MKVKTAIAPVAGTKEDEIAKGKVAKKRDPQYDTLMGLSDKFDEGKIEKEAKDKKGQEDKKKKIQEGLKAAPRYGRREGGGERSRVVFVSGTRITRHWRI